MKTQPSQFSKGFTLLEVMIALLIFGLVAAIAIPSYLKLRQRAVVRNIDGTVSRLKEATVGYLEQKRGLGYIPLTGATNTSLLNYDPTIPDVSADTLTAGSTLESFYRAEKLIDSPIQLGVGPQTYPDFSAANVLNWDPVNNRWDAGSAPISLEPFVRVICIMSVSTDTPGTGTNYYLAGSPLIGIPAHHRVISLVVPHVPLSDAIVIANSLDSLNLTDASTTNTRGRFTWAAPDGGGHVTLYCYVADL